MGCCCKPCNSRLGHLVEGDVVKDIFFAFGIANTRLATKAKALNKVRKVDAVTGERLEFEGDNLVSGFQFSHPGSRSGSKGQVRRAMLRYVWKKFPNRIDSYSGQLKAGESRIQLPGEPHIYPVEEKKTTVDFVSQKPFPRKLLAKIVYEMMCLAGPFSSSVILEFWSSSFVFQVDGKQLTHLSISDSFLPRTRLLYPGMWREDVDYSKLDYKPAHYVCFRCTASGVAWVRICFFGLLHYMVVVGKIEPDSIRTPELMDKVIVFPVSKTEQEYYIEDIPDMYKEDEAAANVLADGVWNEFVAKCPPVRVNR